MPKKLSLALFISLLAVFALLVTFPGGFLYAGFGAQNSNQKEEEVDIEKATVLEDGGKRVKLKEGFEFVVVGKRLHVRHARRYGQDSKQPPPPPSSAGYDCVCQGSSGGTCTRQDTAKFSTCSGGSCCGFVKKQQQQ